MTIKSFYPKSICWCLALTPALLLITNNYSVAVIISAVLLSLTYLKVNSATLQWTKFDTLITICLSAYLIGAIPVAIIDGSTTRYFQGGIRLFLCLPIYLALSRLLKTQTLQLRAYLEGGVIVGSIGALVFACYQYFYLEMARVDGFLFSINFGYLSCALTLLALALHFESTFKKTLLFCATIGTLTVTLTFTRGAIFTIPIILLLITILKLDQIKKRHILGVLIAIGLSTLSMYNVSDNFKKRIDYTVSEFTLIASGDFKESSSSTYRLQFWYGAFEAFKSSPLIGVPYKQREQINHQLYLEGKISEGASKVTRGHAHNQYFEMLASNGVLGIISILGVFIMPLVVFIHHYLKIQSQWAFCATVFVSSFAIFGLTEVPLTANLIGSFYGFMLAVFFAIIAAEKQRNSVL